MVEEIGMTSFYGIVIGLLSFLITGIFHPMVIKAEYHFGVKVWPLFLVAITFKKLKKTILVFPKSSFYVGAK